MTEYVPHLNVYRHHCPLSACAWHYDEDINAIPVRMLINPRTGDIRADPAIVEERIRRLDALAREHLDTHSPVDWADEVRALRVRIAELEAAARARQTIDGIRPHGFPPAEMEHIERIMRKAPPIHITGLDR